MKSTFSNAIFATLFVASFLLGCKKDDDGSKDQTTQVVGTYNGDYVETTDGSSVSGEDITTLITKVSDDEIRVVIQVLPGVASVAFNANMTDETNFTAPKFTLFDSEFQGTGSLTGSSLSIDLDKVGTTTGDKIIYNGTKQ
jgi:hypothetical protein